MKISITCTPQFWITLTPSHVDVLRKLAILHYDSACRKAALRGGFVYGWHNLTRDVESAVCCGTFRDLDLCLKIMESDQGLDLGEPLVAEMRKCFIGAIVQSNKDMPKLEFEVSENKHFTQDSQV
jgi:hypothetical protein